MDLGQRIRRISLEQRAYSDSEEGHASPFELLEATLRGFERRDMCDALDKFASSANGGAGDRSHRGDAGKAQAGAGGRGKELAQPSRLELRKNAVVSKVARQRGTGGAAETQREMPDSSLWLHRVCIREVGDKECGSSRAVVQVRSDNAYLPGDVHGPMDSALSYRSASGKLNSDSPRTAAPLVTFLSNHQACIRGTIVQLKELDHLRAAFYNAAVSTDRFKLDKVVLKEVSDVSQFGAIRDLTKTACYRFRNKVLMTNASIRDKMNKGGITFVELLALHFPNFKDEEVVALLYAWQHKTLLKEDFEAVNKRWVGWDRQKTGELNEHEFIMALSSLKIGLDPGQAQHLFNAIDIDGNGRISKDEFIVWWYNHNTSERPRSVCREQLLGDNDDSLNRILVDLKF